MHDERLLVFPNDDSDSLAVIDPYDEVRTSMQTRCVSDISAYLTFFLGGSTCKINMTAGVGASTWCM